LTEQGFVRQIEHISKTIRELNALGVEVAIDDFGKGYSSLAYLQEFPVSVVKIDKNFIRGVDTDNRARKLSQNILNLCHTLGLKATAEGVETLGEMAILQAQGFDQFQGFLFSKPEPLDELIARYRN
jgi:EAL domain-containing protein (putative c-di-GMP-specific phosphodiesterase class I)